MHNPTSTLPMTAIEAACGGDSSLIEALRRLIDELEIARAGEPPPGQLIHPSVGQWGDDADVYLEAELPDSDGLHADICIQAGRVVIRVSR